MNSILPDRMTARLEGEFVVFIIGMRINKLWKLHKWLPVARAMPRMLRELEAGDPAVTGFLGHNGLSLGGIVQYWRSFDHLETYARSGEQGHWPAWTEFNRRMKHSRGDVGIWHETYLIAPGRYETIYSGMPPHGLGRVGELVRATTNRQDARSRLAGE